MGSVRRRTIATPGRRDTSGAERRRGVAGRFGAPVCAFTALAALAAGCGADPPAVDGGPTESDPAVHEHEHEHGRDAHPGEDEQRAAVGCRDGQVDVNDADAETLQRIVHIGSARAEQVEALRPFINLRDLTRLPGIAEKRLGDILDQDVACAG